MNDYNSKLSAWCAAHEDYFEVVYYPAACVLLFVTGKLTGMAALLCSTLIVLSCLMRTRAYKLSTDYFRGVSGLQPTSYLSKHLHWMARTQRKNAVQSFIIGTVSVVFVVSIVALHKQGSAFADSIVYRLTLDSVLYFVVFIVLLSLLNISFSLITLYRIRHTSGY